MNTRVDLHRRLLIWLCATCALLLNPGAGLRSASSQQPPPAVIVAAGQTATLLPDGRWLVVGGWQRDGSPIPPALVDAEHNLRTAVPGSLLQPRAGHTGTVLADGSVVIVGGISRNGQVISLIERFDPATGWFAPMAVSPDPALHRAWHSATLLTDGRVLITGGTSPAGDALSDALIWDPSGTPDAAAGSAPQAIALLAPRGRHHAELLPDGRVRLSGGTAASGGDRRSDEIIDPDTRISLPAGPLDTRAGLHLSASDPHAGASGVAADVRVSLRFSTAVQVRSVNDGTVRLQDETGGIVAIERVAAEAGMLLFLRPFAPLDRGRTYTLTLDGLTAPGARRLAPTVLTFTIAGERADSGGTVDDELWTPDPGAIHGWRTGREPSPWQRLPPLRAAAGVTAVSGQLLRLNGQPLPGATVRVGEARGISDRTGRFLVESVAAGRQELVIDARTASTQGRSYGVFRVGIEVKEGDTHVLPYTSWMPRIDKQNAVTIASPTTADVVLRTPSIPGLEVTLPAGTVIKDIDHKAAREVSITPIPVDRPPFPLPLGVDVPIYFTIQPGGAYLESVSSGWPAGARIVYPNYRSRRPGTDVDFWHYDPEHRGWFVYGLGTVTPDAKRIEPGPGVSIYEFTGAMVGDPNFGPAEGPPPCNECEDGDPVDLATGLFVYSKTDLALPDVLPVQLTRTYRPRDFRSRPFGMGSTHPYEMFIVGDTNPWTYVQIVLPDGARIHFPRISAGTGFSNAIYEHTATPSRFYKSRVSWNGSKVQWDLRFTDGTVYEFPEAEFAATPAEAAIVGIRDRFGNQLTFTRDSSSRLTRITSPNGRWIEFTYDPSSRISQARDNVNRTVGYEYDASGRLWKVTDAESGVTEYTYDSSHRMKTIKDPRGIVYLTNEYDLNSRVIRQTQADGSAYQFAYTTNASGVVTQTDVTDPRGILRRVTFNSSGYWLADTRAVGRPEQQATVVERQAGTNLIEKETDGLLRRTDYTYDDKGNLTSIKRLAHTATPIETTATYEPDFNQLATFTDPLDHTTTYDYTVNGTLERVTDHLGHSVTFGSNAAGQITSATDPAGTITFLYDKGDLSGFIDGAGHTTRILTDSAGRTLTRTDPLGNVTRYDYTLLNQVRQIVDPQNGGTTLTYDGNGNLRMVTDARSKVTEYTYDAMDRVETRKDPLLKMERFVYDRSGNLFQHIDRRGLASTYRYDGLNRMTSAAYADGATTAYTYDGGNRLRQVVDSVSGTTTLDYDDLDRLTSETTSRGVVTYGYDDAGRRTSMTVAGQTAISYGYDDSNRLTSITQGTSVVGFEYDDANRRTAVTLPNGVRVEYGYAGTSQIAGLTYKLGTTVLGTVTYGYDAAGRRIEMGGTWARTTLPPPLTSAVYDDANRLTQWNGTTLTYDDAGNVLSEGSRTYSWDARNRLSALGGLQPASFQYDAFGRRIGKSTGAGTTEYVYDGPQAVQELSEATPSANLLYGPGIDELLRRTSGATARWLVADGLGSALALTDPEGAVQTRYTYDAFGATSGSGEASGNASQFTGRENDGTGLYYYRARYYSPRLQRFLSEDALGLASGDPNLYAYVSNAPTNWTDPLGLGPRYPNSGTLPGHPNVPYRVDMNQQPHPNMHVKWPDGSETVVNHKGGWDPTHGGRPCARPPKKYRNALRKVVKQFVKKAGRAVPVLGAVLLLSDVAEAAEVIRNPNSGVGDLVNIVVPYKDVGDLLRELWAPDLSGRKDP